MTSSTGPAGRIARFFLESKLTPLLVVSALAVGVLAVMLTPREEEPQIVVPMVDVFVAMPGAPPREVENLVTIPLEKRLWEIPGVEYVYSASRTGMAAVTVRFLVGEDMERSLVKLYDKLAGSMDRMPAGATPPLVKLRTIDDVPVLVLTLWSHTQDGLGLRRVATELGRELARVDDVSDIRLTGGQRRKIRVLLDAERLAAFRLDPAGIAAALRAQNTTVPAGNLEEIDREVVIETGAFLTHADELPGLVVGAHDGGPVYLRDVARIVDGPEEISDYVLFAPGAAAPEGPGESAEIAPAVSISVAKRKGSDAHGVVQAVDRKVESLRGSLIPSDVHVTVTRDYGETSSEKAQELLTHLIVAIISVTFVVGLFLGWRGGFVVFVSVPVTFSLTLFIYYTLGYTLNRVTLFALIFVTGIVVDDSIIVVENIVRHLGMKKLPPRQASINAVNEVGNPTILATLTVIAAVLPMAFVRGLMGPYMRPMPVGATLAMLFSLGIALVVAPWLSFRLLGRTGSEGHETRPLERSLIYRAYKALLVPLLLHRPRAWALLAGVTVLLLLSIALFPAKLVTVKMLPFDNKSEVQVIIDMPEGTTLEKTAGVAREIAESLRGLPEVTDLQIYAGTSAPINFNGLVRHYDLRRGSNVADLQVNLVHKSRRDSQSHAFARALRPAVAEIATKHGASVKIAEIPPGPPVLSTLVSEVYGPSDDARLDLAGRILEIYDFTEGVVDVDWSVEAAQVKRVFRVDHEKAALHGVAPPEVARALRLAVSGETVGVLHDPREAEPLDIELRLPRAERSTVDELVGIRVASRAGSLVPLSALVRLEEATVPMTRYRKNLKSVVYVTGDVSGTQESPVYAILTMADEIAKLSRTDGTAVEQLYRDEPWSEELVATKWDGEWHVTYEVFRDLGIAFGIVLILIYVLIVAWFGSFNVPIVMMIAIPLSLIGILPAHWWFGAFFTATSMIGFIALAGIMVRNSVLLIDFVDQALETGRSLGEAIVEAVAVRTRPILLTAGTVVVGALVILFDPIFEGLAISLMAGAIASTALTLLVIPLVYFLIERRRHAQPIPEAWMTSLRKPRVATRDGMTTPGASQ